ncbi:MAG: DUF302 domain-containing protein [Afipia sp.]|nr:DUF302 domain-containing protein [Afipia sp.]
MVNLKQLFTAAFVLFGWAGFAQAADNLVTKKSAHPFTQTLDRLESSAKANGLVVFTRIDHAAAAKAAGLQMPPATVLVVGNPRGGTPQFLEHPTLAIDLPLKMLVWQNQTGEVSVSYNTAAFTTATLARHGFDAMSEKLLNEAKATETKLAVVADEAVK